MARKIDWKAVRFALEGTFVGFLFGLLVILVSLGAIGALDERPGVNPFGNGPIYGTSPDATPTPVPTPTEEEIFEERKKWDSRRKLHPGNGQNQREKTLDVRGKESRLRPRERVVEFKLFQDYGEKLFIECPDCHLVERYAVTIGGPSEDPWIIAVLQTDYQLTKLRRRFHGIRGFDPFDVWSPRTR
jgi:hypothetical protein